MYVQELRRQISTNHEDEHKNYFGRRQKIAERC